MNQPAARDFFVEQKNFTHVRELFGYERLDDQLLVDFMNEIYKDYWSPLQNYFLPTLKLKEKVRVGSRIKKISSMRHFLMKSVVFFKQLNHINDWSMFNIIEQSFSLREPFQTQSGING